MQERECLVVFLEFISSVCCYLHNFLINFHFHLGRVDYLYSDTFPENTQVSVPEHIQRQFAIAQVA